jgi:exopolyphosphatase/guanosine-5'-triphosphate,3'-diphosphate pyrophosphatase
MSSRLAVIDIGSNTLLLTVGKKEPSGEIKILADHADVIRLSEGLQDGKNLQPEAKNRALKALREFKEMAASKGSQQIFAAGTAAFRRAQDGKKFAQEIEKQLGIPVKILTGDEEAKYSFLSAKLDFGKEYPSLGMIDIGGGSTEFVFGEDAPHFSLPIGTVRLTEKFVSAHPISDAEWNQVRETISQLLQQSLPKESIPYTWVAVAATPASLASVLLKLPHYDPKKIHGYKIQVKILAELVEQLRTKSLKARIAMPGMDPKRAELLPVGGLILLEGMKFLEIDQILVSDHGLRYGILMENLQPTTSSPA